VGIAHLRVSEIGEVGNALPTRLESLAHDTGAKTVNRIERMSICAHFLPLLSSVAQSTTLPTPITPAPPTTAPTALTISSAWQIIIGAAILIGWAALVAALAGVFAPRGCIRSPDRIESNRSPLPILLVTLLGGGVWLSVQLAYGGYVAASFRQRHPGQTFDMAQFGPYDLAFLSTVPALIGLLILSAGDSSVGLIRKLGYEPKRLPMGLLVGVLASISVLPLMSGFSLLLDLYYQLIHFKHPAEHELLGAMKGATHDVRIILVIGACVIAPIFEELLFRGHLQTLLGRMFTPREQSIAPGLARSNVADAESSYPQATIAESAKTQAGGGGAPADPVPVINYAAPTTAAPPPRRNAWLAILITSILFALVHPLWMAPLIFILALCLGYLYERTGNLWACIALHAIFNTASTITFLNMS
jgi:membrane protease YdiL (CAAX protease family)